MAATMMDFDFCGDIDMSRRDAGMYMPTTASALSSSISAWDLGGFLDTEDSVLQHSVPGSPAPDGACATAAIAAADVN